MIDIINLVFGYPKQPPILQGINLTCQKGDRISLLGRTGCGKTSLLENIMGLKQAQSGQIWINNTLLTSQNLRQIRREIGFIFQNPDEQLFMPTILEDVIFGPINYNIPRAIAINKAQEMLTLFGLEKYLHSSAHELSGGQKRLAALAAILALEPTILILDEPTNGLDPYWRRYLAQVLNQLPIEVLLIASHDLRWIGKTTNRTLILADGEIKIDRPTNELLQDEKTLLSYGLPLDY